MAEPETSIAALLAGSIKGSEALRHYGGGGSALDTDRLLLPIVIDYLQRHQGDADPWSHSRTIHPHLLSWSMPQESTVVADALRRLVRTGSEDSHRILYCGFEQLEQHRSDVASLARFSQRVDHATWYLYVAFDQHGDLAEPVASTRRRGVKIHQAKSWYSKLASQCFGRWHTARDILVTNWSVPEDSEPLYRTAFWSLCELTPADSQLKQLFEQDRPRACRELVRHVDAYAEQLALATDLAEALAAGDRDGAKTADAARLEAVQEAILDKAGERLTLTQAAERLGISRQAMHKKLKSGAALGLMIGETFVVPGAQIIESGSGTSVVAHLKDVLALFTTSGAGSWSALQYLTEPDPALRGAVPLERLKQGDVAAVTASASAYLGLDEG